MSTRSSARMTNATPTFHMLGTSGSVIQANSTGFAPWATVPRSAVSVADKKAEVTPPDNVMKRAPLGKVIEGKRFRKQAEYPDLVVGDKAAYACAPRGRPPTYINWSNKKKSETEKPEMKIVDEVPPAMCKPEQLKEFFSQLPSPLPKHT